MIKLFIALCLVSTSVLAQVELSTKILAPATIKRLIGPYPTWASFESQKDFAVLFFYQSTRSEEDCRLAKRDENLSVANLFGGEVGILNDDEVKKMTLFLVKAYAAAGANSYLAKSLYKRPRPYEANKLIKPCIDLEKSSAYPSGHSLTAQLHARILSQVYPERSEQLINRAMNFSMNRVIGGVHHPSDVKSAHILADYLAEKMIDDKNFNELLHSL